MRMASGATAASSRRAKVSQTHVYRVSQNTDTPDPAGGAYSAPPDPLAGFERAYF